MFISGRIHIHVVKIKILEEFNLIFNLIFINTESNTSAFYLDLLLSIRRDGQLHTSIYDKRDDFNSHIKNFPFLSSNISTSPAYGVFIPQLIRYARACYSYGCFILRATRLSNKLIEQGYVKKRLKSSLRKFYGRYGDLIKQSYLLRTPGPVPLGLACVLLVATNPFPNLSLFFLTKLFEYPSNLSRFCLFIKVKKGEGCTCACICMGTHCQP